MSVNELKSETTLLDQAIAWLTDRLPRDWAVEPSDVSGPTERALPADKRIALKAPNGTASAIAVEEKSGLTPRAVRSELAPRVETARRMGGFLPFLVIAPWLSRRTRELLAERGISYIDLTGNALLHTDNPPFYLQTTGSERNPAPARGGQPKLRGAKAARLIRLLTDVRPPYGVGELAEAANLTPGYVSRLIATLDREALLERAGRGRVEQVEVVDVIRRWASFYDLFGTNDTETFIAPAGLDGLLSKLAESQELGSRLAITGSFAARRLAPVAAPAMLVAYRESLDRSLPGELELLPADEGANVALLRPFDPVVFERASIEGGLRYVAPAQAAVDCLTGNGRMPAEGEALLEWMGSNEDAWRARSLAAVAEAGR